MTVSVQGISTSVLWEASQFGIPSRLSMVDRSGSSNASRSPSFSSSDISSPRYYSNTTHNKKQRNYKSVYSYMTSNKSESKYYSFSSKHNDKVFSIYNKNKRDQLPLISAKVDSPKEDPKEENGNKEVDAELDEFGLTVRKRVVGFSQESPATVLVKMKEPTMNITKAKHKSVSPADTSDTHEQSALKPILKKGSKHKHHHKIFDWTIRNANSNNNSYQVKKKTESTSVKLPKVGDDLSPVKYRLMKEKDSAMIFRCTNEFVNVLKNLQRRFSE